MSTTATIDPLVSHELLDAIASFPLHREVTHCGELFQASPLAIYAECPVCKKQVKIRSFSSNPDIEDVFDAVLGWMHQLGADEYIQQRRKEIEADAEG
ncbi:MAG TPA: hypothetical protein VN641_15725 [Urbifossiella sp.]|nr:hypothetical protein [Urbifossiella sp.]